MFEQLVDNAIEILKKIVKKPGSKGGIGYWDEHGKWRYGVRKEKEDELDWEVEGGKFKTKTFKEAKDSKPDLTEGDYKKMYKKAYTEYYTDKKEKGDSYDVSEPKKPEAAKPKKMEKLDWKATDDGKFSAKSYKDMKEEYPDLTEEAYKTFYKKSYTEFYKAKAKGDLDKHKKKDLPEEPKKIEEKPKSKSKEIDEPEYIDSLKEFGSPFSLYEKLDSSAPIAGSKKDLLEKGIKSDVDGGEITFKELNGDFSSNIGKTVFWEDKDGWKMGKITEYDIYPGEYSISGGVNGTFTKHRPADAILVPNEKSKIKNPKYKEKKITYEGQNEFEKELGLPAGVLTDKKLGKKVVDQMKYWKESRNKLGEQVDADYDKVISKMTDSKDIKTMEKTLKYMEDNLQLTVKIKSDYLLDNLEFGRIKNYDDLGHPKGTGYTANRKKCEKSVGISKHTDTFSSIYGAAQVIPPPSDHADWYGDTMIVLKKDRVAARTTVTNCDSFNLTSSSSTHISENSTIVSSLPKKFAMHYAVGDDGYYGSPFNSSAQHKIEKEVGKVSLESQKIVKKGQSDVSNKFSSYHELQIHGNVTNDDYDYILMKDSIAKEMHKSGKTKKQYIEETYGITVKVVDSFK